MFIDIQKLWMEYLESKLARASMSQRRVERSAFFAAARTVRDLMHTMEIEAEQQRFIDTNKIGSREEQYILHLVRSDEEEGNGDEDRRDSPR